jgi:hypothetical protein
MRAADEHTEDTSIGQAMYEVGVWQSKTVEVNEKSTSSYSCRLQIVGTTRALESTSNWMLDYVLAA